MEAHRHIVVDLLILVIFRVARHVWNVVQQILWLLDGTRSHINQIARNPRKYPRSAQLLDIVAKKNLDPISLNNSDHKFMLLHRTFMHPSYVLKPEVSLYYVSENEAVFVEAPSGVQVWRSCFGGWHRLAQHRYAHRMIRMPLKSFFDLVNGMEDPGDKLTFLEFIPRVGSTLMCQVLEETGQVITFAEPEALVFPFANMRKPDQLGDEFVQVYLQSVVKFMCRKTDRNRSVLAYMTKIPVCFWKGYKELYEKCFPKAKYLFQYRNVEATVRSMERAFPKLPFPHAYYYFLFRFPSIWRKVIIYACCVYMKNNDPPLVRILENSKAPENLRCYVYYATMMASFLESQTTRVEKVPCIKYEDLLGNPRESVEAVFSFLGVPQHLISQALAAFEKDSQAGSHISRDRIQNGTTWVDKINVPDGFQQEIDDLFTLFQLPRPDKEIRIPNTITKG